MHMQAVFQQRVRTHPDELHAIMQKLSAAYQETKLLKHVDPKLTALRLEELLSKVRFLQQLPADAVPVEYGMWTHELARIYSLCELERRALQRAEQHREAAQTTQTSTGETLAMAMLRDSAPVANHPQTDRSSSASPDGAIAPTVQSATTTTFPEPADSIALQMATTPNDTDAHISPWIRDWTDPTLQSEAVRRLVRRLVVPIVHPDTVGVHSSSQTSAVLVDGPANVGKSWALRAIRNYLQQQRPETPNGSRVKWVEWTAYDCPERAKRLLETSADRNWTMFVTDRVSAHDDLEVWAKQPWLSAWCKWLERHPRAVWVVVMSSEESVSGEPLSDNRKVATHAHSDTDIDAVLQDNPRLQRIFRDRCTFGRPDKATVFHYLKRLIHQNYSTRRADGTRHFPSFVRLPVVSQLPQLADWCDRLCATRAGASSKPRCNRPIDFHIIDHIFRQAMEHCARLALANNVVYGVADVDAEAEAEVVGAQTNHHSGTQTGGGEEHNASDGAEDAAERAGDGHRDVGSRTSDELQSDTEEAQTGTGTGTGTTTPAATHHWYPKNSVDVDRLPPSHDYRLVAPLRQDLFEWCPRFDGRTAKCASNTASFWNTQLFDTLSSAECDRVVHMYMDPDTTHAAEHSVIANFPVATSIFPHHLHSGFERCFEWAIALWMASVHTQHQTHRQDSARHTKSTDSNTWLRWDALRSMSDVCHAPTEAWTAWLRAPDTDQEGDVLPEPDGDSHTSADPEDARETGLQNGGGRRRSVSETRFEPEHTAKDLLQQFGEVRASQITIYVELQTVAGGRTAASSPEDTHFHLTCGGRSSAEMKMYRQGIPGSTDADALQRVICELWGQQGVCDVVQVRTHSGVAFHIDFRVSPKLSLHARGAGVNTQTRILPRVTLLTPCSGVDLDGEYRLTTERDVDILTEAFPRAYKDMYRNEQETWMLKPVRHPDHLAALNREHSSEVKCYLKMCCDLMRAKQRHYALLKTAVRGLLDDALTDVQSHLDYLLQIVPEQEDDGQRNWSMSANHPAYNQQHPPDHNEVDKVIPLDVANEWLRRDMAFSRCHRAWYWRLRPLRRRLGTSCPLASIPVLRRPCKAPSKRSSERGRPT